ncbi:GDSL esterase/lipase 3-like isoform X2 [Benincasa hispida]|uniref:GDSL esterase/lipase 3-like isoform X2 n=1 Tax=Benincasa hispida TaxID=102211 RepID=UPI0019004039|nr:GDSL esterase/lipase 3-like isoform X2 [Benincasa hispida]
MKISNLGICVFFFYIFILFGIAAPQSAFLKIQLPHVQSWGKRFGFFIFGDSYVDAGNNNYINLTSDCRANFPPYGETFFPIPTGRFSDAEYAQMPFIQAYLDPNNNNYTNGVNFASGGAGALVETNQKKAIGLQTQMMFFKRVKKSLRKKLGNERSQSFLSNSVFLFHFGGNDYLNPLDINYDIFKTIEAQEQFVNMVIGNITIALKEVYNYGGRKFGIMALPPTGYLPNSRWKRSEQYFQESSSITRIHNNLLFIALQKLATQLNGFKYAFADTHTFLLQTILNPTKFGESTTRLVGVVCGRPLTKPFENTVKLFCFKVVDTACCGSGEFRGIYSCGRKEEPLPFTHCTNLQDYLFYDSYHPTEKASEQLAKLIWNGDDEIVKPYNFKQLFQYDSNMTFD